MWRVVKFARTVSLAPSLQRGGILCVSIDLTSAARLGRLMCGMAMPFRIALF